MAAEMDRAAAHSPKTLVTIAFCLPLLMSLSVCLLLVYLCKNTRPPAGASTRCCISNKNL